MVHFNQNSAAHVMALLAAYPGSSKLQIDARMKMKNKSIGPNKLRSWLTVLCEVGHIKRVAVERDTLPAGQWPAKLPYVYEITSMGVDYLERQHGIKTGWLVCSCCSAWSPPGSAMVTLPTDMIGQMCQACEDLHQRRRKVTEGGYSA